MVESDVATAQPSVNNRTRGITAAIEGFFAFMWFRWGQADPPSWLVVPLPAAPRQPDGEARQPFQASIKFSTVGSGE